ncbi:fam-c protein [Plasmodium vinckei lentum]|uniref:Fam-c protein n=1 Tax=Plasmodium vinckei lentum TaxID=138297 RepID=A0A6V7S2T4_PLAVN|nr:fam-c protein [Plasmodium vinckei lentum]
MNEKIFSLVCILFYILMAVSIYCSEQKDDRFKESGLRSRIARAFKKTKRSNKKNDTESERESQLNNNNNNDDQKYISTYEYYKSQGTCGCFGC